MVIIYILSKNIESYLFKIILIIVNIILFYFIVTSKFKNPVYTEKIIINFIIIINKIII